MQNVYDVITEKILAALESGVIPWRKEWTASTGTGLPVNFVTRKPYRGINVLTLLCSAGASNEWLTYKQAQSIGAQVRKGAKGSPVVFWKFDNKRTNTVTGELEHYVFAKQYTVFNVDQCDGIPAAIPFDAIPFDPIAEADAIVARYLDAQPVTLAHGGGRACYSPTMDAVTMPARELFSSPAGYYSTLFHELIHSTGHKSRLDRFTAKDSGAMGSESYSKEELIAEFGAAFVCAEAGIANDEVLTNSAAYIQGWMRSLKNDRTLAVSAAQRAQRAADMVLVRSAAAESEAVAA